MKTTRLVLLLGAAVSMGCILVAGGQVTVMAWASPEHPEWPPSGPVAGHARHSSHSGSGPSLSFKRTRSLETLFGQPPDTTVELVPSLFQLSTSKPIPNDQIEAFSVVPLQVNLTYLIGSSMKPPKESTSDLPGNLSEIFLEEDDNSPSSIWRYSIIWTVALCVAYLVVFFLGLVGNLSVLWVIFILRRNSRHSMFATCNKVFNGLIGNLALADLLVIIFCLPATLIANIFTPYFLGRFVCKFSVYFQGVSVSASVYTLVAISIDRFYGIYYPFNNGFSQIVRRSVIIFIWGFSFSIAIPWIFFFDLVVIPNGTTENGTNLTILMCQEVWPDQSILDLYFLVVNLGLQYLVPLSIIFFFYLLLMIKIWRRKIPVFHTACRRETSTDTVDQWNSRIVEQSKIKVLKMLLLIVSLFMLSWLPLYLIFLKYKFGSYDEDSYFDNLVLSITPLAQWLGASNSASNCLVYFFFNSKFRKYLKKALTRSLLCSSSLEFTRNQVYTHYNPNNNHPAAQQAAMGTVNTGHNRAFNQLNCPNQKSRPRLLNGSSLLGVNDSYNNNNHNGLLPSPSPSPNSTMATVNDVTMLNTKSAIGFSLAEQVDATLRMYCCQNGKASPSPPPAIVNSSVRKEYEADPKRLINQFLAVPNGIANRTLHKSGTPAVLTNGHSNLKMLNNGIAPMPLHSGSQFNCSAENVNTMIQFSAQSNKTLFPLKPLNRETSV